MSDEAAFLQVLKANPADDTARLVFADWLDEHNEPQKAEYLRLVADVARRGESVAAHPSGPQLVAHAKDLPADWRFAAGSRFALIVDRFFDIVKTVKWFREVTECGLGEAKVALESAPYAVYACVPFEMAFAAYAGSSLPEWAVIRIAPSSQHLATDHKFYRLVLNTSSFGYELVSWPLARDGEEPLTPLARLLRATGVALTEPLINKAIRKENVMLVEGLTLDQARARMGELTAIAKPGRPGQVFLRIEPQPNAPV